VIPDLTNSDSSKTAPWPRHVTMPASHHSVFYRPDALPAVQPTVSKHWRLNNNQLCPLIRNISNKRFLLIGDFNYPNVNLVQQTVEDNANGDCEEFLNCCNDCFLTQHVLEHTRGNAVLDSSGFSQEPDLVSDVRIIENLGNSDQYFPKLNK